MTTTGPIEASVTFGTRRVAGTLIGARVPCTTSAETAAAVAARLTRNPSTDAVTTGFELRKSSCESAGLRSNRSATRATNVCTAVRSTVARSPSVVFGATLSAFATAVSAETVEPRRAGVTVILVRAIRSSTGRSNAVCTACVATSGASPPTAMPPIVTPAGDQLRRRRGGGPGRRRRRGGRRGRGRGRRAGRGRGGRRCVREHGRSENARGKCGEQQRKRDGGASRHGATNGGRRSGGRP